MDQSQRVRHCLRLRELFRGEIRLGEWVYLRGMANGHPSFGPVASSRKSAGRQHSKAAVRA